MLMLMMRTRLLMLMQRFALCTVHCTVLCCTRTLLGRCCSLVVWYFYAFFLFLLFGLAFLVFFPFTFVVAVADELVMSSSSSSNFDCFRCFSSLVCFSRFFFGSKNTISALVCHTLFFVCLNPAGDLTIARACLCVLLLFECRFFRLLVVMSQRFGKRNTEKKEGMKNENFSHLELLTVQQRKERGC